MPWQNGAGREEGARVKFWDGYNALCLDRSLGYTVVYMCQTHLMVHLRFLHFIVCKFLPKEKANKYWTLVNNMHAKLLKGRELMSAFYFEFF